jgi:drug/metabolite transporter (DMT)-like permease
VFAAFLATMPFTLMLAIPAHNEGRCQRTSLPAWGVSGTFVLLGSLLVLVHCAWYASFALTRVSTNTILWNTDTVTTPIIAAVFSRQRPSAPAIIGACISLVGAGLAAGSGEVGNTVSGCSLCLAASAGYALNGVVAERLTTTAENAIMVPRLLGVQGLVALVGFALALPVAAACGRLADWGAALPPAPWLVCLMLCSLMLNLGWLWSTQLAGASWTAAAACLTMPLSMVLDSLWLDQKPSLHGVLGAVLITMGVAVVPVGGQSAGAVPLLTERGGTPDRGGLGPERGR